MTTTAIQTRFGRYEIRLVFDEDEVGNLVSVPFDQRDEYKGEPVAVGVYRDVADGVQDHLLDVMFDGYGGTAVVEAQHIAQAYEALEGIASLTKTGDPCPPDCDNVDCEDGEHAMSLDEAIEGFHAAVDAARLPFIVNATN